MGATTVWERYDSMLPDGSINPGEMTSFNHYALGAVADWMHRRVAGLAPGEPGYRSLTISPLITGQLTSASAKHLTPYGEAAVAWTRSNGEIALSVTVPVGTRARVDVPGASEPVEVGHGTHEWTAADPYVAAPELPADPTVRQLIDHEASWDAVVAGARESGFAPDDAVLAARLERYLDQPATALAEAVDHDQAAGDPAAVRAALESLLNH
jgi:alpha-L-rhamnosidase